MTNWQLQKSKAALLAAELLAKLAKPTPTT